MHCRSSEHGTSATLAWWSCASYVPSPSPRRPKPWRSRTRPWSPTGQWRAPGCGASWSIPEGRASVHRSSTRLPPERPADSVAFRTRRRTAVRSCRGPPWPSPEADSARGRLGDHRLVGGGLRLERLGVPEPPAEPRSSHLVRRVVGVQDAVLDQEVAQLLRVLRAELLAALRRPVGDVLADGLDASEAASHAVDEVVHLDVAAAA